MKRNTLLYLTLGGALVMGIALYLLLTTKSPERTAQAPDRLEDEAGIEPLPDPAADLETRDQIERLWPDLKEKEADEHQVRRYWQEFSARYPDNIYIPDEYKPAPTKEETEKIRAEVKAYLNVAGSFRNRRRLARNLKPGETLPEGAPAYTPGEQKLYFEYRIKELKSKIQLVEYSREQGALSPREDREADVRLADWNEEIEELSGKAPEIEAALRKVEEG